MRNSARCRLPRDRSFRGARDNNTHRTSAPRELNARAVHYRNLTYVRLPRRQAVYLRGARVPCAARPVVAPTKRSRRRKKLVRRGRTAVTQGRSVPKSTWKNSAGVQLPGPQDKTTGHTSVTEIFGRECARGVVQRAARGRPRLPYLEVDVTILGKVCQIW